VGGLDERAAVVCLQALLARGRGRWWIVQRARAGYEIARYPSVAHPPPWARERRTATVFSARNDCPAARAPLAGSAIEALPATYTVGHASKAVGEVLIGNLAVA
jgi:hypothetical protein